ncbi:unnamed protein product [Rhodiola kirilowii]
MAAGSNRTYTSLFRTNQNAAVSALSPNYSEVFGRLDGGGVPVLKLPVNHQNGEKELSFDLGLVDYDEVFGGYDDWSFAASYEDVFGISSGGEMLEEEEACWTHLEDASSLEKPYHFTQYAQSNILSSENGNQSLDINRRLRVLDRIIPSESKGDTETGLKNSLMERSDTDSIRCGRKSQNVSQSNGAFRTISGINLRTHPSKCPPPSRNPPLLYVQNEDLKCLRMQSRGSRSRIYSFKGTVSSPTFHDVEVDASSSAAASAAAMLDAMEKAQAKLNSAKEMMQRTYHLKPSQKNSVKQSCIDGSRKLKENLVHKVKVATEGRKSFACDGVQNLTYDAEMVSQSREEMNQNSIDHKFVVKRRRQGRQGSWSCRDSEKYVSINGAADSSDLFDMELADKQLLEVQNKKEMASERAGMQKEQMKYETDLSSANDQKTTKTQLAEADSWNKRDISTEVLQEAKTVNVYVEVEKEGIVTKRKSTDGRTSDKCDVSEHWQMKTEAGVTEQCDQGLERKTFELAEFGSELKEEACGREQNFKGLSLTCDPEENEESLKQSYEFNVSMERSETLSKRQNIEQFTVAREVGESKKLQSDDYTTTMSASHAKPYLSEEHFMDGRAEKEIVKPLGLLYEQTENRSVENSRVSPGCVKLDLNAGDVGHEHEEDIKIRPGFDEDIFEENHVAQDESLCEKMTAVVENDIRTLHLGDNNQNSAAAATGQYAAQEVLIQSHVFSESNDHEEMVTEFGEEVVCNKGQVPVSGLMTSDPQKLPKMVDLEVQHLPKSRPTSENSCSFQQHHRSDEAVNISMLGKNEKMLHEQLKKLEKERNREREKDNLVVERALHEVHEKARNDVEKAAVERGPTECQQNAVGDSVKPKELQADSPQRCKARLERQRRTAERAARALAEKNMCDLAAQREQAERNRLADSLGAEVKRWATGKEGNLRALLSTLQYILGPDSGWKPIPLTEVITPVAVKKAYRKATLYVHPDKVQQRGANVQQKFICEKVFDLIKDAWNKFNSDA